MAENNLLKGFDEKTLSLGKGIKQLDDDLDKLVRKFRAEK